MSTGDDSKSENPQPARPMLRVALAGAGMISRHHLLAWQRNPAVQVVGICDPDPAHARTRADEFGIADVFSDYGTMLRQLRPDAVDVASPVETHAALVHEAAAEGIDVLCQKPLCSTLGEAEELVRGLAPGPRLMVHENWRFRPWYRTVSDWLRTQRLGTLRQVRMSTLGSGLLADEHGARAVLVRQPYMGRIDRLMVGEVLIHHLDVLRWLLGPLRVGAAAIAYGCDAVRGESCASVMMLGPQDVAVVLEGNMCVRGYPPRPRDRLEIIGDHGRILLDGPVLTLDAPHGERHDFDIDGGYQASFDAVIAHFVECLRSGTPFETSPDDNLQTLRLVEAVYASARTLHS